MQTPKSIKVFWVDLPNPEKLKVNNGADEFTNVAALNSRRAARELLKETYGMSRKVADFFITEGSRQEICSE